MNQTCRSKNSVLYLGLMFLLGAGLFGLVGPFAVPPQNRGPGILFFGGFSLCFALASLYLLLEFFRYKLIVSDDTVEFTGILRTERIRLDEACEAQWRGNAGGGYLKLQDSTSLLTVNFSKYTLQQGRSLIRFFHSRLPMPIQTEWEKYWAANWRYFDRPVASDGLSVADKTRRVSRRFDLLFGFVVLAVLPAIVAASLQIGPVSVVPALLLPTFYWLFFRFVLPVPGQVAERFPPPANHIGIVAVGGIVFIAGFMMTWMAIGLPDVPAARVVLGVSIVLLLMLAMRSTVRHQSRRKADRQQAAQMAAELYLQEPS